jgi:2-polyprenyl-6-hydroxyphenyl methylase/3-demethylubiquinone-9 3-methyltransferase
MEFYHDVHDWMGGWPYESILPVEVDSLMNHIGFAAEMLPVKRGKILGRDLGVFGSGCDEYLYKRV